MVVTVLNQTLLARYTFSMSCPFNPFSSRCSICQVLVDCSLFNFISARFTGVSGPVAMVARLLRAAVCSRAVCVLVCRASKRTTIVLLRGLFFPLQKPIVWICISFENSLVLKELRLTELRLCWELLISGVESNKWLSLQRQSWLKFGLSDLQSLRNQQTTPLTHTWCADVCLCNSPCRKWKIAECEILIPCLFHKPEILSFDSFCGLANKRSPCWRLSK